MMSNNKILTVSYGTFSCTLEGFEDSFGTMKAIAEYFRDLAADDRYFGAEPPQPDAEMLARIAQKEMSRRVEAREQDGQIVLSAVDKADQPAADQPAAGLGVAAIAAAPAVVAGAADDLPRSVEPAEAAPDADDHAIAGHADERHADEQSADAPEANADVAEAIADQMQAQPDLTDAENLSEAPTAEAAPPPLPLDDGEVDIVPGQPDAEVEAFFATGTEDTTDTYEEDLEDAPAAEAEAEPAAPAPAPDSIAAKLQRIRDVVAQNEEAADEDDYLEDEHAEDANPTPAAQPEVLISDTRDELEAALAADEVAAVEGEEDESDDVNAILSRLDDVLEEAPEAAVTAPADPEDRSVEDTVSNLFDENEDTLAEVVPEDTTAEAAQDAADAPRARVIKVKRADLESAIESGDLEEYGEQEPAAPAKAPPAAQSEPKGLDDLAPARSGTQTALSAEDEAALAQELADLEADIDAGGAEDDKAASAGKQGDNARDVLPAIDPEDAGDVNRLLAESDHQMDEPESATRRDAFAHLRAAVAAKKADVAAGAPVNDEDGDDAYRNDLAEVVRPRRPVSASARSERPGGERPAPLKLVAEQRIDVAKPRPDGPVRPRRVSAQADAGTDAGDGESFADFATEMGATSLPQLLEAAAAYMSFVEGREQFSRPQLMTKVRQAGGKDGFSREESLRSFGQLLRTGKIEKIKAGRFTVSDDIGFRPDERAAG